MGVKFGVDGGGVDFYPLRCKVYCILIDCILIVYSSTIFVWWIKILKVSLLWGDKPQNGPWVTEIPAYALGGCSPSREGAAVRTWDITQCCARCRGLRWRRKASSSLRWKKAKRKRKRRISRSRYGNSSRRSAAQQRQRRPSCWRPTFCTSHTPQSWARFIYMACYPRRLYSRRRGWGV